MGAAVQGGVLAGDEGVLLLDVTAVAGCRNHGSVMTPLITKNTDPKAGQVFSTAEDNQSAVTIHVLQGEQARRG